MKTRWKVAEIRDFTTLHGGNYRKSGRQEREKKKAMKEGEEK